LTPHIQGITLTTKGFLKEEGFICIKKLTTNGKCFLFQLFHWRKNVKIKTEPAAC